MQTKSKKLEGNKVRVTVTLTPEEINQAIENQYKDFAKKYKFPGFRPGKAPRQIVDSVFGKDGVTAKVTDDLVNQKTPIAIDDEKLFPAGNPDFGKKELDLVKEGQPYTFEFDVEVDPVYELSSHEPVEITLPPNEATDKEIDHQVDAYRNQFFSYADAPKGTKIDKDATLNLNIKAKDDDGKEIENLTNEKMSYHLGSKFLPEDFEKQFIGKSAGDKLSFTIDMPKEPTVYTTALVDKTKKIAFDVVINSIQTKSLPEINDEWVKKNMGFETVKEFRNKIKEQINAEKAQMLPILKENKSLAELAKRLKGEVPESAAQQKEAELLQDFFTQLQQKGMTFDQYLQQYGTTADQFKEDVKKQAHDVAKQDLALDALANKKGIEATDKDIEEEFKHADQQNWKKLYNEWHARGELNKVRKAIMRMKAAKHLVANAKVTIDDGMDKKDNNPKESSKGKTSKSAKKAPAKKTVAKKAPAKSASNKKAPAKKTAAKKAPAKKAPAKKTDK